MSVHQAWMLFTWHSLTASFETVRERLKQDHRGRPRKDESPIGSDAYRVQGVVGGRDLQRAQAELQRRSAFVLVTVLPVEEFTPEQLLIEYNSQSSLEQRFHFMKDPAFVDAFFLHKPERVEALGYVLWMACLVFSLLERRVRRAGVPLDTPSRGKLDNPTGFEILHHMKGAIVVPIDRTHRELHVTISFRKPFRAVLEMAGFDDRVYTRVPLRLRIPGQTDHPF